MLSNNNRSQKTEKSNKKAFKRLKKKESDHEKYKRTSTTTGKVEAGDFSLEFTISHDTFTRYLLVNQCFFFYMSFFLFYLKFL